MKYALSRKWEKHLDCKIIYYFVRPLSSLRRHFASAAKWREAVDRESEYKMLYASRFFFVGDGAPDVPKSKPKYYKSATF